MPFIANEGQTDEKVAFYANTFGGTVFVTKGGEIVYALPGRDEGQETRVMGQGTGAMKTGYGPRVIGNVIQSKSEILDLFLISYSGPISKMVSPDTDYTISQSKIQNPKSEICNRKYNPKRITLKENASSSPLAGEGKGEGVKAIALKEELVGGKINEIKGEAKAVTKVNYFKGKDPSQWKTNISTYDMVTLGEIYKGIELKLKAYGNNVEKLFHVKPGASPESIQVKLSGAKGLRVNEEGQLVAETELGHVKFTKPVAYQEIDGKRVEVAVEYSIQNPEDVGWVKRSAPNKNGLNGLNPLNGLDGFASLNPSYPCQLLTFNSQLTTSNSQPAYGFKVASYDRTKDLIIDPLLASTYLGGSDYDAGYSLTLDTSGNVYVTGYTESTDFPTTSGAYDTSYNGDGDVFVSKLDSNLSATSATPTPTPTPTATAAPTPSPTITPKVDSLLEKYAPILYMHGQERFHPANVEVMLDNSELYEKTCKKEKNGECKKYKGKPVKEMKNKEPTLTQLMDAYNDDIYYLQLKKKAKKKVEKDWKERQTVYAHQTTDTNEDGKGKTILQYWFFYVYNDWGTWDKLGNTHEGDWEMIQIILGKDEQGNVNPERITFSFHHGGESFEWDEKDKNGKEKVAKSNDGNRPLVYITLGGHGCWNSPGDHIWYQYQEKVSDCWKCTDKTDAYGDVLYPNSMSDSEITEIQSSSEKYSYTIEDMTDWIYWKGYWGLQTKDEMNGKEDFGSSGPQSPPYIDYINAVVEGEKSREGRWYKPIKWADAPRPSDYTLCNSDNSKVVINYLESNSGKYSDYCNWTSDLSCDNVCSNLRIIYSEEDLVFDVYSLDGKEVDLKISRHKRKGEIYEVEFNSLEIPKNGKASLTFSPEQNPSLEIGIDNDMDGLFDIHKLPDHVEFR